VDAGADGLHRFRPPVRPPLRAVGDQIEGSECAPEPAPEVAAIVRVLDDTDRDKRVGDLEEDRRPAAQEPP
jgi:hypothetical protein